MFQFCYCIVIFLSSPKNKFHLLALGIRMNCICPLILCSYVYYASSSKQYWVLDSMSQCRLDCLHPTVRLLTSKNVNQTQFLHLPRQHLLGASGQPFSQFVMVIIETYESVPITVFDEQLHICVLLLCFNDKKIVQLIISSTMNRHPQNNFIVEYPQANSATSEMA